VDEESYEQLPPFYYVVESDPDLVILRSSSGRFVGAFSARGFIEDGLVEAA
jgi:hypothetical protein